MLFPRCGAQAELMLRARDSLAPSSVGGGEQSCGVSAAASVRERCDASASAFL